MIMNSRKFLMFVILAVILNIVVHILYLILPMSKNNIKQTNLSKFKSKFGQNLSTSIDWQILICNDSVTRNVSVIDLNEEISQIRLSKIPDQDDEHKLCPLVAPGLGPVVKDINILNLHGIDDMYLRIEPGGIHIPSECVSQQQVAIVVAVQETTPQTNSHIGSFIYYMHPFLMKQQLEYQIFVLMKRNTTSPYERGKLFNIGYVEAQAYRNEGWDCIVFHDAHLLPLDTRNLYRCSKHPRRLIADFRQPNRFGGAVAIDPRDFARVNGFSNLIWSNDGDYINMYRRLTAANFSVESNCSPIGNYTTLDFLLQCNTGYVRNETFSPDYSKDGLSNLSYSIQLKLKQFYTLIEIKAEES